MTLRDAVWFTAGLLITMAVAFLPRRLLPQTGAPLAFRTLKWPLFGALIVAVPILIFSAWRGASNQSRTASVSALSASRLPTETAKVHGGGSLDAMLAQLESRLRGGNGTAVDWELARMLGASGYTGQGMPVRAFVSRLVASCWVRQEGEPCPPPR